MVICSQCHKPLNQVTSPSTNSETTATTTTTTREDHDDSVDDTNPHFSGLISNLKSALDSPLHHQATQVKDDYLSPAVNGPESSCEQSTPDTQPNRQNTPCCKYVMCLCTIVFIAACLLSLLILLVKGLTRLCNFHDSLARPHLDMPLSSSCINVPDFG